MATVYQTLLPEEAQFLSANFPQYDKVNGTNFPVAVLRYDASAATDEEAFWKFHATNYGSGNLTVEIWWYSQAGNTTGDVIWASRVAAITAADAQSVETKAFGTAATVTTTVNGTSKGVTKSSITVSSLDSIASGDICWLGIARDGNNASDTMAGDASLLMAVLSYSDT